MKFPSLSLKRNAADRGMNRGGEAARPNDQGGTKSWEDEDGAPVRREA